MLNVVIRWIVNHIVSFEVSIVIGFFVALSAAFILNRYFVFGVTGSARGQFWRFLFVNLLALVQVWLVSELLFRKLFPVLNFSWNF